MINIEHPFTDTTSEMINLGFAYFGFTLTVVLPVFLVMFFCKNSDNLKKEKFKDKYGFLY